MSTYGLHSAFLLGAVVTAIMAGVAFSESQNRRTSSPPREPVVAKEAGRTDFQDETDRSPGHG